MAYYRVAPPPSLRGLVRGFSYWEGGEPSAELLAVMATRTPSLQIDLHDDELRWYSRGETPTRHVLRGVTLSGAQTRPLAVDAWQPRIVRVIFEPGGTVPFFAVAPADLRDAHVCMADVWGPAEALQHRSGTCPGAARLSITPRRISDGRDGGRPPPRRPPAPDH